MHHSYKRPSSQTLFMRNLFLTFIALFLTVSQLQAQADSIAKYPKKEIEKKMKIAKKAMFNHALVEMLLKISGCTLPTI